MQLPPERLGSFYLGAHYDPETSSLLDEPVNYDARDLTTHAVCVGMTGSGKTGLCVGLLEEAAMDKVPALIIDPKGDMTNLLLQFENLEPSDFAPWINADDAGRKGMSTDEYAASMAGKWKSGLSDWGITPERIRTMKETVDFTIYTPGSDAGIPVNIMGSLRAPKGDFDTDAEGNRERIAGTVGALLSLADIEADVRSREVILLSTIFEHFWRKGEDLDMAKIILSIQKPPVKQLGVFDVETFYPEKDRFGLAMAFNSLVASPQFQSWMQGDPLDIDTMYFTPGGKPRHSVFYIAHLSDTERMFFVTLLLENLVSWMRRQSGTTSLRSLLYFDEIFGYFPPTAQPPSKRPMLTLLKQARAFGLGCVLVTQNPVDIDYKGLSNTGTWFIGKLQTERDKMRVLEGLEGAIAEAGSGAKVDFDKLITGLDSRVFLLHNVHDDGPVVYHTRWAMSYLRGPMTRPQVKQLMESKKAAPAAQPLTVRTKSVPVVVQKAAVEEPRAPEGFAFAPPSLDPGVRRCFLPVGVLPSSAARDLGKSQEELQLVYRTKVGAFGRVRFYDSKKRIDEVSSRSLVGEAPDDFGRVDWESAQRLGLTDREVLMEPDRVQSGVPAIYQLVPDTLNTKSELKKVEKDLSDWFYQNDRMTLMQHKELELVQEPGESKEGFFLRIQQAAREERDEEVDELQDKYEPKFDRIRDRLEREESELRERQQEYSDRKSAEFIGVAESVIGMFSKRRRRSAGSAMTKRRMRRKAGERLKSTKEELQRMTEDMNDLGEELNEKIEEIQFKWDTATNAVEPTEIKPRRADVQVDLVAVMWVPYWSDGRQEVKAFIANE